MSDPARAAGPSSAAWQRWQPDALMQQRARRLAPDGCTEAVAPEAAAALASELQAGAQQIEENARARGHEQGYAEGYAAGRACGLEDGTALGHAAGAEAGHTEGLAQGRQAGAGEAAAQAARLAALADELGRSVQSIESEIGEALVSLAVRIAEHVLQTTLETQPGKITDLVQAVLRAEAGQDCLVTLRLHPDDVALVRDFLDHNSPASSWRLAADGAVARGGCIASTALGSIDATLATRWKRVLASLGRRPEGQSDA